MVTDVKIVYKKHFEGMMNELPRAVSVGNRQMGMLWHSKMLKEHFTLRAEYVYGYARRSSKYLVRKLKTHGHKLPLVFSGALRDALIRYASIESSRRQVKVRMIGPKWLKGYVAFKGRAGTGPDKSKEIRTITKTEARELADVQKRAVVRISKELKSERTVKL